MATEDRPGDSLYHPLNEEERLAIRAELRERNHAMGTAKLVDGKEGQKLFAQHHHATRLFALTVAAEHGKAFVRYLVLLNGGAVIAILTLIGTLYGKAGTPLYLISAFSGKLQIGLYFFLAGLMSAALIAAAAFWQWLFYAHTFFHEGQTSNAVSANNLFSPETQEKACADFEKFDRASYVAVGVCVALGAASMICFGAGAVKTAKAFAFFGLLR